jgi:hypothetical protein
MNIRAVPVSAHREQPKEKAPQRTVILSRKQELNLQLNQLIDGVLLVFSFWSAHTFRFYLNQLRQLRKSSRSTSPPDLSSSLCLLALLFPGGSLCFDQEAASLLDRPWIA